MTPSLYVLSLCAFKTFTERLPLPWSMPKICYFFSVLFLPMLRNWSFYPLHFFIPSFPACLSFSVHRNQCDQMAILFFQYLPYVTKKCAQKHWKFSKWGSTVCQILSQLANNCQRLLKCCHYGEILPYLVTLIVTVFLLFLFSISFCHSLCSTFSCVHLSSTKQHKKLLTNFFHFHQNFETLLSFSLSLSLSRSLSLSLSLSHHSPKR